MIKLKNILLETINFNNWVTPSDSDLKREFKVEHELKGYDFFENEDDFLEKCKSAKQVKITRSTDSKIRNRTNTQSFEELLGIIKNYRSYPKYRNKKTLKSIYDGFKENNPMVMPIVLKFKNGDMRVFAGNTRMDVAFQLGINPKVLVVNVD